MVCGACGTTIADKAIVCYRCGQATAIPDGSRPAPSRRDIAGRPWLWIVVLLLAAAALHWLVRGLAESTAMMWAIDVAAVVTVVAAALLALRRPGRRP